MTWLAPASLEEALDQRNRYPDSVPLAGGTDVLVRHHDQLDTLSVVIALERVRELRGITVGRVARLNAGTTHHEIATDPWFLEKLPMLASAATSVGGPQIKHRGTLGGNVGNASPAADMVPPLIALGATIQLSTICEMRTLPLEDFFLAPGRTDLRAPELITAFEFPVPTVGQGSRFIKLGTRKAMSISVASIAVSVRLNPASREVDSVRICYGSLGPTPIRARRTEEVLRQNGLAGLREAENTVLSEISPIDDIRGTADHRKTVAREITRVAVTDAFTAAEESCDG